MHDLGAVLKREVSPDRLVGGLVEGARGDVLGALGAVVARVRASALGDQVKGEIADLDQLVKASVKEREALRVEVAALREKGVMARAELDVARLQKREARAGLGDLPDVTAAEDQVKALEREWSETRSRLTTVANRVTMAQRQKVVLAEVLSRLESLPVGDPDVLAVLGGVLANSGEYS